MLITWIDIAVVAIGAAGIGYGLWRRPRPPAPLPSPPPSAGELLLTLLAAVPAAVGSNVLVVALTPGMPAMPTLVRLALLPSVGLLGVVWVAARAAGYTRLVNRIEAGLWVGFVSTAALDAFRLTSFSLGLLPGNMPRMFGVLILDQMAAGPSTLSDVVGAVYHFWVSACFGLAYTLLVGRTRWWGGLIWGLIVEVGMMTTSPMVIAMGTGYFGLALGKGLLNGVFLGSLVPHISFGVVLGLLLERYVAHRGTILGLVRALAHRQVTDITPGSFHVVR
ncbi:MAG: hypothetical protein Q8S13_00660 [Dehalococcoidia bacterium]|nr:hypothetical protein [Dehalococcoidia bacterium]